MALGLLSVLGLGFIGSQTTEIAFLAIAVSVGVVAVVHGVRKHHSVTPSLFFVAGIVSWLVSHFVFQHGHPGAGSASVGGTVFAVLGGLCLVTFHLLNQRLAHRCGCNHCTTGE